LSSVAQQSTWTVGAQQVATALGCCGDVLAGCCAVIDVDAGCVLVSDMGSSLC
jgi:hypothetical protein